MESEKSSRNDMATTFDEASMESSKSFVAALQELKNLRPQLYSAADYCEKSYLHSEQKQMVLDNLKDYAVRALVNAVDHLGTVASKLTDVFERQNLDISTMDFKVSCLSQQILTCQAYMDTEGLRQQELLAMIPRHHKHYILPNSVSRRVHFSPLRQADARQNHHQAISRLQPSDSPASKSLSWHLGSGNNSTSKGSSSGVTSLKDERTNFTKTSGVFHLLGGEQTINKKTLGDPSQLSGGGGMTITMRMQHFGAGRKDMEGTKPFTTNKPLDKPRQEIIRAPIRNKGVISSFFVKQKTPKLRAGFVS